MSQAPQASVNDIPALINQTAPMLPENPPSTPVHRLPPETLSYVFDYVCHSSTDYWSCLRYQYSCMQVCHYWDQIIQSTPSLWTDITLEIEVVYRGIARPAVRLEKSRSLSISFCVCQLVRQRAGVLSHYPFGSPPPRPHPIRISAKHGLRSPSILAVSRLSASVTFRIRMPQSC